MLGTAFGDGDEVRLAVHGRTGREHDVLDVVLAGDAAQHQRAGDVVPVVLQRLLDAFAHGLEAGEVDDGVDVVFLEDALKRLAVEDVVLVERQAVVIGGQAGDLAHAVERHLARIAQVVDHDDAVTLVEQFDAGVAADETGAAGDQNADLIVGLGKALVGHDDPFLDDGASCAPCSHAPSLARGAFAPNSLLYANCPPGRAHGRSTSQAGRWRRAARRRPPR